jgi:hypothetical protein
MITNWIILSMIGAVPLTVLTVWISNRVVERR